MGRIKRSRTPQCIHGTSVNTDCNECDSLYADQIVVESDYKAVNPSLKLSLEICCPNCSKELTLVVDSTSMTEIQEPNPE